MLADLAIRRPILLQPTGMSDEPAAAERLTVDEAPLAEYGGEVPTHLAVIMDGNGRWARNRDLPRIRGHRAGASAVRSTVESCRYLGVDILTLYAFSSENWERPDDEVTGLMTLFDVYIERERERLIENDVRVDCIGNRDRLPDALDASIADLAAATADGDELLVQVAVSYGGREEILRACRELVREALDGEYADEDVDEETFSDHLYTKGRPDPDLLLRTSGEQRLSNFLLWQTAYSEFCFIDTLWPDFDEYELVDVLREFDRRDRRFGKTGQQLSDEG